MKKPHDGWNPYLAGGLSGLLVVASVWVSGKYFGASTTFVRSAGLLEKAVAPDRVSAMEYFIKEVPKVDWQMMFVIGIAIGAFIAAISSGDFLLKGVPDMWREKFGPSIGKRGAAAFFGGAVAMFGARLADG